MDTNTNQSLNGKGSEMKDKVDHSFQDKKDVELAKKDSSKKDSNKESSKDNSKNLQGKDQANEENSQSKVTELTAKAEQIFGDVSQRAKDMSETVTQGVSKNMPSFLKKGPVAIALCAVGVGVMGTWLVKKMTCNKAD